MNITYVRRLEKLAELSKQSSRWQHRKRRHKRPGTLPLPIPIPSLYTLEGEAEDNLNIENDDFYHNILVGGAMAGGRGLLSLSRLPFGALAKGPNHELFRWNQKKEIRKAIRRALANKLHPRLVGHSWGGATVANLAKEFPEVPVYAMDPTSWTGRLDSIPKNLTIYRPYPDAPSDMDPGGFLAPIIGGRWPKINKGEGSTKEYWGGHAGGVKDAVNGLMYNAKQERMKSTERAVASSESTADKDPVDWSTFASQ